MTPEQFAQRAVGLPWVRWASSWAAADCFGLVLLYWREVHGAALGGVPRTDIESGFRALRDKWEPCEALPGATAWMAWRDGAPRHCGVLLPGGLLLHAEGSEERGGSVRATRLPAMRRLYPDIRFYRPAPC